MRQQWRDRYGATYYAFTYQNVLFLCLDSNDGDGVTFSDEQVSYIQRVLDEHPEVHWTMLFLHHPIWDYEDLSGFQETENGLERRDYTVIASHRHRYLYEERNDQRYITLATTGGGSHLRGPQFGEYDHIVWITMSLEGSILENIQLDSIHSPNLLNPVTREYANHLLQAVQPQQEVLTAESDDQPSGELLSRYNNLSDLPLQLEFHTFHHHQIALTEYEWSEEIPANEATTLTIPFTPLEAGTDLPDIDPIQYQWSLCYQADSLSGLQLSGTEKIPIEAKAPITFTPTVDKFLDNQTIGLEYPLDGVSIHYTLDGSEPIQNSAQYTSPISISQTTILKAVVFRDQLCSPTYE
ncbi:MAG: FN3 associated domain-containing protein [Bacteroidota bacterium]